MDNNILTEKLMKFGCIGNTLNWFKSYLTNIENKCVKLTERHQNVEQFLAEFRRAPIWGQYCFCSMY